MHVVHLGLCQWLNASATILLAKFGYLQGENLGEQLEVLTKRFNAWCRLNGIRLVHGAETVQKYRFNESDQYLYIQPVVKTL